MADLFVSQIPSEFSMKDSACVYTICMKDIYTISMKDSVCVYTICQQG